MEKIKADVDPFPLLPATWIAFSLSKSAAYQPLLARPF
jgi:hypothetical protein